ncbi:CBS domain-containing protein [Halorubrum sp. SD683]|uniref:CBS domain-containing protein n=1 Tax=Halorubrum sp. SD683 TaxID=1855873 RepID=UPI000A2D9CEC|nr:CBS domain-containing protein [Halorubrum sp. SD683]OTF01773.1 signal transduction protein [Halorubrum sp. SD683]
MPVINIARTDVMTASRDQSAGNLATVMKEENVGSVIIENDGEPVGIVTDRDLMIEVLEPRGDPTTTTAEAVMTETPVTVDGDQGVFDAIRTLRESSVRRLPVVDEDDAIAGIVTLDDLVVLLSDELDSLSEIIEAESPPY